MIRCAAAAQWGEEVPNILSDAWQCKQWNTLPETGGYNDQPLGLLKRMTAALNVYNAFNAMAQADNIVVWMETNKDQAKIVADIQKLRAKYG